MCVSIKQTLWYIILNVVLNRFTTNIVLNAKVGNVNIKPNNLYLYGYQRNVSK